MTDPRLTTIREALAMAADTCRNTKCRFMETDCRNAITLLDQYIAEQKAKPQGWQDIAKGLAASGYIVNVATTPHGCCASILNEKPPYEIYRCQNAPSLKAAFEKCRKQMPPAAKAEGEP